MFYVYIIAAVALIPILNNFFEILKQSYSWWLVPVLVLGIFVVLVVLHIGIAVLLIATANTKKPIGKKTKFYRAIINITLPMVVKLLRVHIHSKGLEKVPEGQIMLVCNHRHDFDPAIMVHELPKKEIAFIGKKEICTEMPFVNKAMHVLKCLPIDRENNREGAKTIVQAIKLLKEDTVSIGVFPEGYTNMTDAPLLPLRNGVFKIALKSGVPIVVATAKGTPLIVKNLFRRKTDIYFDIVDVITPEEYKDMTTAQIGERVSEKMIACYTSESK